MRAEDVVDLQRALHSRGLDWCVVGGWGVDALQGRQSRVHPDLDVLVSRAVLHGVLVLLGERGFGLAQVWQESRTMAGPLPVLGEAPPSAFVLRDDAGRALDVHVTDVDGATPLWTTDLVLTVAELSARGRIGDVDVRCMTGTTQLACHTGYLLPAEHADDVQLLRALLGPGRLVTRPPGRRAGADRTSGERLPVTTARRGRLVPTASALRGRCDP